MLSKHFYMRLWILCIHLRCYYCIQSLFPTCTTFGSEYVIYLGAMVVCTNPSRRTYIVLGFNVLKRSNYICCPHLGTTIHGLFPGYRTHHRTPNNQTYTVERIRLKKLLTSFAMYGATIEAILAKQELTPTAPVRMTVGNSSPDIT